MRKVTMKGKAGNWESALDDDEEREFWTLWKEWQLKEGEISQ
jgi:hypothetical protein